MRLDRTFQNKILTLSAEHYPRPIKADEIEGFLEADNDEEKEHIIATNLMYLQQHGLIEDGAIIVDMGYHFTFGYVVITHDGLDFIADDGGLSAILGVVTIKFEADQLRLLLESKIMESDLPLTDKYRLIDQLRALPGESIKHLITKVVDLGWDNLGSLVRIIQSSLF